MAADYRDRIVLDPDIRFGKPVVRGTRLTVADVLGYLAGGMSETEVLAEFPQLRHEDVLACLGFAAERERRVASLLRISAKPITRFGPSRSVISVQGDHAFRSKAIIG